MRTFIKPLYVREGENLHRNALEEPHAIGRGSDMLLIMNFEKLKLEHFQAIVRFEPRQ